MSSISSDIGAASDGEAEAAQDECRLLRGYCCAIWRRKIESFGIENADNAKWHQKNHEHTGSGTLDVVGSRTDASVRARTKFKSLKVGDARESRFWQMACKCSFCIKITASVDCNRYA